MPRVSAFRRSILFIVAGIILANVLLFGGHVFAWVADTTGQWMAPMADRIARLRTFVTGIPQTFDAASRIGRLEDENGRLRGLVAQQEELKRELTVLREASGVRERLPSPPLEAGIFSYQRAGGARYAVINRGTDDGVGLGDVVISSRGELIGIIEQVFDRHANVRMLGDVSLTVTARVSESDVAGLVRTDGAGSLMLDLIAKDESVVEGASVVTSGDDHYPAGLIIGTVRSVDNDAATLFKIVHLSPSISGAVRGSVMVFRP